MGPIGLLEGVVAVAGRLLMVLSLAVFSLIVAESAVFWRLKLDDCGVLWLLLLMRGAADGGPAMMKQILGEKNKTRDMSFHLKFQKVCKLLVWTEL